jgi:hypothetical protein
MNCKYMYLSRRATGLTAGVCALGTLIVGCSPDDTQAPRGEAMPPGIQAAAAPIGAKLHVGLANTADLSDLGQGPGNDATGPAYGIALGNPPTNWTTLNSYIDQADAQDIILVLSLAGGRQGWTKDTSCAKYPNGTGLAYDSATYESKVRRFAGHEKLADAIARHRAVVYLVDEPFRDEYCGSLPPARVNNMGRLVKSIWNQAITIVRGPAGLMKGGWGASGPLDANDWDKVDYGWSQYNHAAAVDSTPVEYFTAEKAELASINLGMIPGLNIWNGGKTGCWDYLDTESSSGRIRGSEDKDNPAQMVPCSTPANTSEFYVASPGFMRTVIDAAVADSAAPFFSGWTHIDESSPSSVQVMAQFETRKDFVNSLDYWINTGASRSSWAGWRTPKP